MTITQFIDLLYREYDATVLENGLGWEFDGVECFLNCDYSVPDVFLILRAKSAYDLHLMDYYVDDEIAGMAFDLSYVCAGEGGVSGQGISFSVEDILLFGGYASPVDNGTCVVIPSDRVRDFLEVFKTNANKTVRYSHVVDDEFEFESLLISKGIPYVISDEDIIPMVP